MNTTPSIRRHLLALIVAAALAVAGTVLLTVGASPAGAQVCSTQTFTYNAWDHQPRWFVIDHSDGRQAFAGLMDWGQEVTVPAEPGWTAHYHVGDVYDYAMVPGPPASFDPAYEPLVMPDGEVKPDSILIRANCVEDTTTTTAPPQDTTTTTPPPPPVDDTPPAERTGICVPSEDGTGWVDSGTGEDMTEVCTEVAFPESEPTDDTTPPPPPVSSSVSAPSTTAPVSAPVTDTTAVVAAEGPLEADSGRAGPGAFGVTGAGTILGGLALAVVLLIAGLFGTDAGRRLRHPQG